MKRNDVDGFFIASGFCLMLAVLAFASMLFCGLVAVWVPDPDAFWGPMISSSAIVCAGSVAAFFMCVVLGNG